jgi:antitoxin-like ribbon-helix-helix protein
MAKRATLTLDDIAATRQGPAVAKPPDAADGKRRGQVLWLTPAAWRQLKLLSIEESKPAHALLIDGVNLMFEHHGKPPIA